MNSSKKYLIYFWLAIDIFKVIFCVKTLANINDQ